VWYRAFAAEAASRHGIVGFARNLPDGRVEVVAAGDADALAGFRSALGEGLPDARVDAVDQVDLEPGEQFTSFTIRGPNEV
jgi:acylphosphatase